MPLDRDKSTDELRNLYQTSRGIEKKKQKSPDEEFIDDDCAVVDCISGIITVMDERNYSWAYQCPHCKRQAKSRLPVYPHDIWLMSDNEMATRKLDRERIIREFNAQKKSTCNGAPQR